MRLWAENELSDFKISKVEPSLLKLRSRRGLRMHDFGAGVQWREVETKVKG